MDFSNRAQSGRPKFLRIHFFADRHRADQVMRDFCERCGVGFRRQKIEAAIDLKCIRADNFRAEIARAIGRELGLSSGGWAYDEKYISHKLKHVVTAVPQPQSWSAREDTRLYTKQNGRCAPSRGVSRLKRVTFVSAAGARSILRRSQPASGPGILCRAIPLLRAGLPRWFAFAQRRTLSSADCADSLPPLRFERGQRR